MHRASFVFLKMVPVLLLFLIFSAAALAGPRQSKITNIMKKLFGRTECSTVIEQGGSPYEGFSMFDFHRYDITYFETPGKPFAPVIEIPLNDRSFVRGYIIEVDLDQNVILLYENIQLSHFDSTRFAHPYDRKSDSERAYILRSARRIEASEIAGTPTEVFARDYSSPQMAWSNDPVQLLPEMVHQLKSGSPHKKIQFSDDSIVEGSVAELKTVDDGRVFFSFSFVYDDVAPTNEFFDLSLVKRVHGSDSISAGFREELGEKYILKLEDFRERLVAIKENKKVVDALLMRGNSISRKAILITHMVRDHNNQMRVLYDYEQDGRIDRGSESVVNFFERHRFAGLPDATDLERARMLRSRRDNR